MGMFDNVKAPLMGCPGCGADLNFQTKDLDCTLDTYTVRETLSEQPEDNFGHRTMRMIGSCDQCRWWIEVEVETFGGRARHRDSWAAGYMERNAALEAKS